MSSTSHFFFFVAILIIGTAHGNVYVFRIFNNASENLLVMMQDEGNSTAGTVGIIEHSKFEEIYRLDGWEGNFYALPEECSTTLCSYPASKASFVLGKYMFGNYFDFIMVDLLLGFNFPVSIKSVSDTSSCAAECKADFFKFCAEPDLVKNAENKVVSCSNSILEYKEWQQDCPQARAHEKDVKIQACGASMYEITFG